VRGKKGYLVCTQPAPSMTVAFGATRSDTSKPTGPAGRAFGITAIGPAWMKTLLVPATAAPMSP